MKIVKRNYTFDLPIPHELRNYLKIKYSFTAPALPADLRGKTFDFILGTSYTALELFIIKRKLFGPQWLLVKQP